MGISKNRSELGARSRFIEMPHLKGQAMTCTHCNAPQGEIHLYRRPIEPAAICDGCVSALAQVLARHVCRDVPDLTPLTFD